MLHYNKGEQLAPMGNQVGDLIFKTTYLLLIRKLETQSSFYIIFRVLMYAIPTIFNIIVCLNDRS